MSTKQILSVALVSIMLLSILSPIAVASTVHGPSHLERTPGKPNISIENFLLEELGGNYTLCIKNGDEGGNRSSSSLASVNGEKIITTDNFNQNVEFVQENVFLQTNNELIVEIRAEQGSHITYWVEDDSPSITIDTPSDDNGIKRDYCRIRHCGCPAGLGDIYRP